MSLDEKSSSTKQVLDIEGLNYLLQKLKVVHVDRVATESTFGHVKLGPVSTPTAINGEGKAAPSYHVHPAQTEITGNAGTASKLKNPVNIALTGPVTGNADFDGSKDITIPTAIDKNAQNISGVSSLDKLDPGEYTEPGGNKYTDSPLGPDSSDKFIIQVVGNDITKIQFVTDPSTGKIYYRVIQNGVASDWSEFPTLKNGNINGNASTVDKLKVARSITISGDAYGTTKFDGSKDVIIDITLEDTGVDADTYGANNQTSFDATNELVIPVYTVGSDGRITSSSNQIIKVKASSGALENPVNVALTGDVTGSASFDGKNDTLIDATLRNSGIAEGTYGESSNVNLSEGSTFKIPKLTFNAKGIATSASNTSITIPSDFGNKVKSSPVVSGKIYLSGKTSPSESTSTDVQNSELYYDADTKILYVPNISGNLNGSSETASRLSTARNIALSGDATGTTSFDGTKDVSISTTLSKTGVTAGSYGVAESTNLGIGTSFNVPKFTVDGKGRVTLASNVAVTLPADTVNKVKTSPATSGIIYITGKTSADESTTTEVLSPNLYYDVTNNTLHAGKITGTIEGVSDTANKLATARNISLTGDATGSTSFDGSKDVSINTTLKQSGATAGTYGNSANTVLDSGVSFNVPKITITDKGIVTSASTTTVSLPAGSLDKVKSSPVTSGKIYISGKASSTESTTNDIQNSDLYYDVDNKTLNAPNISGNLTGTASSASKLATARNISLTGDATGTASFDGSKDASIATTLANSGVTAGSYGQPSDVSVGDGTTFKIPKLTFDAKGRATSAGASTITVPASALNRVKSTEATSGLIYLTGKSSAKESTSTDLFSSKVYYDVTNNVFHAGKINATIEGVSDTANKLANARVISLMGDASGSTSFDGSEDVVIDTTLKNTGVSAGTFGNAGTNVTLGSSTSFNVPKFTVDAKGRLTVAGNTVVTLPADSLNKVKSTPTTTGKIYLSGKTTSTESTSTDVQNSDLYYDTDTKTLNVPNISGKSGSSASADKLATARNIALSGDATGTASFDGSKDVTISTILSKTGVTAGNYGPSAATNITTASTINIPYITVDAKGRITAVKNNALSIPANSFNKVSADIASSGYIFISGKPELKTGDSGDVINSNLYYDIDNDILHAGKIAATIEGVSDSANKLAKAVNISLAGAVTGSQAFDGSKSITIQTSINEMSIDEIDAMMDK